MTVLKRKHVKVFFLFFSTEVLAVLSPFNSRFSQELRPMGSGAAAAVFCLLDGSDQGILLDYQAPYSSACDGLVFKDWHDYTDFVPSADVQAHKHNVAPHTVTV